MTQPSPNTGSDAAEVFQPRVLSEIRSQVIEVPHYREEITYVPKKEIVEVEKFVPKVYVEYVEKVVEVPQIEFYDTVKEVEEVHVVDKFVPRLEVVNMPKEFTTYKPKIEIQQVEKIVEVPGDVVEIPRPYTVTTEKKVPQYKDREVPIVVSQKLIPVITESNEEITVDVNRYVPQIIPVDVYVPVPAQTPLIPVRRSADVYHPKELPAEQYNRFLLEMNKHCAEDEVLIQDLPFIRNSDGSVVIQTQNSLSNSMYFVEAPPNIDFKST